MSDFIMTRFEPAQPVAGRADARRSIPSLHMMLRAHRTRAALANLSARERADIGVSSAVALAEAARLPWDVNPGPRRRPAGILGAITRAFERFRTRRLIARLDVRELRDLGLGPSAAQAEASKFFWQT